MSGTTRARREIITGDPTGRCYMMYACGARTNALNLRDIVARVAFIPDSLSNWSYGEKRHEEGKAFGC